MYIPHMETRVSRWGNSLAVRLPRSVAEEAGVTEGDLVDVVVQERSIVVRPRTRRYTLEDLLSGLPEGFEPETTDWGPPRGKEIW